MAENITPEEISDAIAEIISEADRDSIVLTDRKLALTEPELSRLVRSQADKENWRGWIVTFLSIPEQTDDGDCQTETVYSFLLQFLHFYLDDYTAEITTNISFQRAIFQVNEALNAKRHLDFKGAGQPVRHSSLQSEAAFDIDDLGGGSANQSFHIAAFSLNVSVTNKY
jgi:hypothetical protein